MPQGLLLGPILFELYIVDILQSNASKRTQFADDAVLYIHHRQLKTITKNLQTDLDKITEYMKTWKIKTNATKTKEILFNKKAKPNLPALHIDDTEIQWMNEIKYLDITLNKKLELKVHFENLMKISKQLLSQLYLLINYRNKLNRENKINILKIIYVSILTYSCELCNRIHLKRSFKCN